MPQSTKLRVVIDYTNWKGKRSKRTITPLEIAYTNSPWHPEGAQWFLLAVDHARGESRHFALKDIHSWETP